MINNNQTSKIKKNKELTKRALINAVGTIVLKEGFAGLGINKVAKVAGIHKKLIYRYFGNFNGLVENYIVENDYWMVLSEGIHLFLKKTAKKEVEKIVNDILINLFLYFRSTADMQQIILWELSGKSDLMRSIHRAREASWQQIFTITEEYFNGTPVNFRAIAALLVGGIYYMTLHSRHNGNVFSDMDITDEASKQDIINAIEMIIKWSFEAKEVQLQ